MKWFLILLVLMMIIPINSYSQTSIADWLPTATEDTSPTTDDLVFVVNNPTGTKDARKVTIASLFGIKISTVTTDALCKGSDGGIIVCTTTSLTGLAIGGGTASRNAEWDGDGYLTSSDTATTGTGAPVKGTGPTISLGENSTVNNGTGPTVNAAGELGVDTTSDQFKYYGGAERVLPYKKTFSVVVPSVVDTDDMVIMKAPYGMTMVALDCIVSAATSATINIQECDSAGANCADTATSDLACDTDGNNTATFSNAVIDSGDWIKLDVASVSGTPGVLTVTATYSVVGD